MGWIWSCKCKIDTEGGCKTCVEHYNIALAYKDKVNAELDRLECEGVIEPVDSSDWATSLVPLLKSNGKSKFLDNVVYPLLRVEEIFNKLSIGKKFSKIDLQLAYTYAV